MTIHHVIITRPEITAQPLVEAITARGDRAILMPFFSIEPVEDKTVIEQLAKDVYGLDYIVFVSPSAVHMSAFPFIDIARSGKKKPVIVAVGPGTAAAIQSYGYADVVFSHQDSGADAVLALPRFCMRLDGQRIGIVNGEQGNIKLASAFRGLGATVTTYPCYRRTRVLSASSICTKMKQVAEATGIDAIIVTTTSAMRQLACAANLYNALYTVTLIGTHPHIVSLALSCGFSVVISSGPQNAHIVNALYAFLYPTHEEGCQ